MPDIWIPVFERVFRQPEYNFADPLSSAAYYVLLIENFPTSFSNICTKVNKFNIKPNRLVEGRNELLAKGFIAEIDRVNVPSLCDFGREMYLPVNPSLIWQEYKERFNLSMVMEENEINNTEKKIGQLTLKYEQNFGETGLIAKNGSISVYYSGRWILFTLINNLKDTNKLDLMLSGLESFDLPFRRYYEKMLCRGLAIRVLFDPSRVNDKIRHNVIRLRNLQCPKQEGRDTITPNLKIKKTPVESVSSRRVIHDNFAIDGRKLLETAENNMNHPSYYSGTIYFDKDPIDYLTRNFESAWKEGESFDIE